jgi:hypothetical protein
MGRYAEAFVAARVSGSLELLKEPEDIHVLRRQVAQAARDYQANRMTWDSFIGEYGECEDELIGELVDLIEHEPTGTTRTPTPKDDIT